MKNVAIFVDISNIYFCSLKKFNGRKVDFKKYLEYCKSFGDIKIANAYGAQKGNEANQFIFNLKNIGFTPYFKEPKEYTNPDGSTRRKADWDVGITIDIVRMIDRIDFLILGTADGDMVPLVKWAKERGVTVFVLASGISRELKDAASNFSEITESMLEEQKTDELHVGIISKDS